MPSFMQIRKGLYQGKMGMTFLLLIPFYLLSVKELSLFMPSNIHSVTILFCIISFYAYSLEIQAYSKDKHSFTYFFTQEKCLDCIFYKVFHNGCLKNTNTQCICYSIYCHRAFPEISS